VGASRGYDVLVVGAGLVGLATARALHRRHSPAVCVLEAEERVAAHQSGHNSGVIHSGLYYRPGSEKARLCRAGRAALLEYCRAKGIPARTTGKLVVATRPAELGALAELERRGRANGLAGIERLGPEGLRAHEPHVAGIEGLWVPEAGVVDYAAVARSLAEDVRAAGGEVRLGEGAGRIRRDGAGFVVETPRGELRARTLVNCAGAQADRVARRAGVDPGLAIVPFRGEFKRLDPSRADLVRTMVYPVPDPALPFLGVHVTRRVSGDIEVGPNAVLALHRFGYRLRDVSLADTAEMLRYPGFWRMLRANARHGAGELYRSLAPRAFARAVRRLVPAIEARDLSPLGSGVRAQAVDPDGSLVDDFRFVAGPGSLHVLCAPSPAATACLAIGEAIAERARGLAGSG